MSWARTSTRVFYEWDLESFDPETDDIIDHAHFDKCPGLPTEPGVRLVLVRDEADGVVGDWDNTADLVRRCWAYVEDGKLPEVFDDGFTKVPQRFHKELARALA